MFSKYFRKNFFMSFRNIFLVLLFSFVIINVFSQVTTPTAVFQYGSSYVGNPAGNGMDNLRLGTGFGIVNVMFTNATQTSNNNVSATAVIETNDGQSYTLTGVIYGRTSGNSPSTFFWSVDPTASLSLNVSGSIPLLLTGSTTATATTGVPPAGGAIFKGIAVVKVGSTDTYTAGSNVNGNSGQIVTDFNNYTASIPQITTNTQASFTNTQVNGWGGVATVPSGSGTVSSVGVVYGTSSSQVNTASIDGTNVINVTTSYPGSGINFSTTTTGLQPNTTYYYRAYVRMQTGAGTAQSPYVYTYYQGLVKSFTTCSNTPVPGVANSTQTFCSSASPTIASLVAEMNVTGDL